MMYAQYTKVTETNICNMQKKKFIQKTNIVCKAHNEFWLTTDLNSLKNLKYLLASHF